MLAAGNPFPFLFTSAPMFSRRAFQQDLLKEFFVNFLYVQGVLDPAAHIVTDQQTGKLVTIYQDDSFGGWPRSPTLSITRVLVLVGKETNEGCPTSRV